MENNNERSSMEIFEKDKKIAFVDSFSDAALSYEYEQAGFTINLMQRSVLLFNHNIKKNVMSSTLRKNMNSTFIYPYSNIREINYSLPTNEFEEAEVCILTDDILNPSWEFNVPTNSKTEDLCEQLVEIFNTHVFIFPSTTHEYVMK